nr:hypothetical protein OG781_00115 [Streptomyces sp. NBC_00830]WTB35902.1 hypothetical protein OG781_46470 [Streptomyces sp. NBC_00830]
MLLRLGEPPSPVPAPVAALLLEHITNRGNMNTATNPASRWLFPGRRTGQPLGPNHLSALLNKVGIPIAAARGAAIRQQLLELPAPVVADALGYHDKTTSRIRNETDRRNLEPIRPWRSRKVTNRLGSSRNRRQLNRRAHQYRGRFVH